ncbi:MAG: hypothetical protein L7U72_09290, partial [Rubripirellula sp.]|nr:hypothetical protein [Rubripirellula sp.]
MQSPTPRKTFADYAAIAIAPLLIFVMISSLANFLTIMFYHGAFPARVSWIIMMFTLGAVAIARVAIEQDRAYSIGYAVVLGLVAFIAMQRFLDSPAFVLVILAIIGYLSDAIVRDCTLIDESADSSDQGLMDSGQKYLKQQLDLPEKSENPHPQPGSIRSKGKQPGRTVMYLALAALPLFGIGQLFLRNDAETWQRAQRLLAFYLFAALSLLVTTSFLGLRRYLRQRRVEMPGDVAVGWITGGLLLITAVLVIAFALPMPGKALANLDTSLRLETPDWLSPSKYGWGNEGTTKQDSGAAKVTRPDQETADQSTVTQQGAKEGEAERGNRESGPAGKDSGGKQ